jgi:hypothetical protein
MIPIQVIALFCITFIALGIFNVLTGRRRRQQANAQGVQLPWYKQLRVLTGIEYVLIGLAFLLNISINYHWLPANLNVIVLPFYLVVLLASGILAGVVIYQGINNARRRRTSSVQTTQTQDTNRAGTAQPLTAQDRAAHAQKLRERRQKAAAARRRRAGKA